MKGIFLFDIDGVIRDVTSSYRLAIQQTVNHFADWKPSIKTIDQLKTEGIWNNDWDTSLELIKRSKKHLLAKVELPSKEKLIEVFNDFYFGGDPNGDPANWTGFIKNESLLVENIVFEKLSFLDFAWGFVSGAEKPSARFVLENRLGLNNPPLISMEDAPDKPNPKGLIKLAEKIFCRKLGAKVPPIIFIGDTIADVKTIINARKIFPSQKFISIGIAPPHLHLENNFHDRREYERKLKESGADIILNSTKEIIELAAKF